MKPFVWQHVAGYIGVSDTYQFDNFFVPINQAHRLLTQREIERMKTIDMDDAYGSAYQELIVWALSEVEKAHHSEIIGDHPLGFHLRTTVLSLRDKLATLYNYQDQPVPFFYVHFVCLVSAFYLPLFAVKTAITTGIGSTVHPVTELVSGLMVLLQVVYVIGLRRLANNLANPYGSDDQDLSVLHYVSKCQSNAVGCRLHFHSTKSYRLYVHHEPPHARSRNS
jgi:predicted membrane chloride channel (bestrophin family)